MVAKGGYLLRKKNLFFDLGFLRGVLLLVLRRMLLVWREEERGGGMASTTAQRDENRCWSYVSKVQLVAVERPTHVVSSLSEMKRPAPKDLEQKLSSHIR